MIYKNTMRQQHGFSLVEVSLYLGLLLLLVSVALPVVQQMIAPVKVEQHHRLAQEANIFFQQFVREVEQGMSYNIETDAQRVHVVMDEEHVYSYEQVNETVRRQRNGAGHLVLAQQVAHIQFVSVDERMFKVRLELENGELTYMREHIVGLKVEPEREEE